MSRFPEFTPCRDLGRMAAAACWFPRFQREIRLVFDYAINVSDYSRVALI